jgi:hypothetical protein
MRKRCLDPKNVAYRRYGGRGIQICGRWLNSYEAFLEDMGERPEGRAIERIDNDGNYEPSNCRWATLSEQFQNTRGGRSGGVMTLIRTIGAQIEDVRCNVERLIAAYSALVAENSALKHRLAEAEHQLSLRPLDPTPRPFTRRRLNSHANHP